MHLQSSEVLQSDNENYVQMVIGWPELGTKYLRVDTKPMQTPPTIIYVPEVDEVDGIENHDILFKFEACFLSDLNNTSRFLDKATSKTMFRMWNGRRTMRLTPCCDSCVLSLTNYANGMEQ